MNDGSENERKLKRMENDNCKCRNVLDRFRITLYAAAGEIILADCTEFTFTYVIYPGLLLLYYEYWNNETHAYA